MAELSPVAKALLETIAGPESNGNYGVMYGGSTFDDFSDHPRQGHLITSGPNKGQYSTAAGKYQFLKGTWDEQAKELGLTDFSPASQDQAAWHLAETEYRRDTGRDLSGDLSAGDLSRVPAALRDQWTSVPGGIEQGINGSAFGRAFNRNLTPGAARLPDIAPPRVMAPAKPAGGGWLNAMFDTAGGGINSALGAIGNQTNPIMRGAQAMAPAAVMQALSTVKGRTAIGQYLMNQNIGKAPVMVAGSQPGGTQVMAINKQGAVPATLLGTKISGGTGNTGGDPFGTTLGQNMDVYRTNAAAVNGPITRESNAKTQGGGGTMVRLR